MTALLSGVGSAAPSRIVTNAAFAPIGLTDRWITDRTGIRERRRLGEGESLVGLATEACGLALEDAGRSAADVDFVVAATLTHDLVSPSLASMLAARLGIDRPGAVDVNGACAGFIFALDYAVAKIESGRATCALVCGADANSRIVNAADPATAPLFGDGAGAVLVTAGPECPHGCRPAVHTATDGRHAEVLRIERGEGFIRMDGVRVYQLAIESMSAALARVCAERGFAPDELDLVIPHQANLRIIRQVAAELGVGLERVATTVSEHGNTSAASIPCALDHAQRSGTLKPGARLAMAAFGAGISWGAVAADWKGCAH